MLSSHFFFDSADGGMVNPPFVNSVCASADGRYIAAGLGDGTVSVYTEQCMGLYNIIPSVKSWPLCSKYVI